MRVEACVTTVTWMPIEAVEGPLRTHFELGVAHYDPPPPDRIEDMEAFVASDACRFANELGGWIEVDDGRIVGYGQTGGGRAGRGELRVDPEGVSFPRVACPDLRPDPEVTQTSVRFRQTAGGLTGLAAPRRMLGRDAVRIDAPPAWTTLALTVRTDGSYEHELVGASPFPRHWVYDQSGALVEKTGLIEFDSWYYRRADYASPWDGIDDRPLVTRAESELERGLSELIIGSDPGYRQLHRGETLIEQGDPGGELFLLFDGVLEVERDGEVVAQLGPGAVLGEMALVDGGERTATLRAITDCRVAVVPGSGIDRDVLERLAAGRPSPKPGDSGATLT